jgi:hypothetical protein
MLSSTFDSLDQTFKTKDKTKALQSNLKSVREEHNLPIPEGNFTENFEEDFQEARDLLKRTAEYSEEAIKGILHIAKNSDHPRAYEVAGQLIKTLQDNAKDIMEIQEKAKKVKADTKTKKVVTNNNLFVGSTRDLLKALKFEDVNIIEQE